MDFPVPKIFFNSRKVYMDSRKVYIEDQKDPQPILQYISLVYKSGTIIHNWFEKWKGIPWIENVSESRQTQAKWPEWDNTSFWQAYKKNRERYGFPCTKNILRLSESIHRFSESKHREAERPPANTTVHLFVNNTVYFFVKYVYKSWRTLCSTGTYQYHM